MKILSLILLLSMFAFLSCGDEEGDSTNVIVNPDNEDRQEEEEGTFSGNTPVIINNRIENNIKVITRVKVENDNVDVDVDCNNAPQNVVHHQYIHIGVRCPTLADDTNNDGYVDWNETQQVAGPPLVSLDRNIETQEEESFPTGQAYRYSARASLSAVRQNLPSSERFSLSGRVLIIYGIDPRIQLPTTVSSNGSDQPNVTIPIFCHVIQKVGNSTGADTTSTTGGTTGGSTDSGTTSATSASSASSASTAATTTAATTTSTSTSTTGGSTDSESATTGGTTSDPGLR